MNGIEILRASYTFGWEAHRGTLAEVTTEVANHKPLGEAGSIASAMAHVVLAEDMIVNGVLFGRPPLYESDWRGRTGVTENNPFNTSEWRSSVNVDVEALAAYRQAVVSTTEAYLDSEPDLEAVRDMSAVELGQPTVGWIIANLVVAHLNNITGEISALKGAHGLPGYPF
jgi:hypothetical protein